jgi:hypothetical protein
MAAESDPGQVEDTNVMDEAVNQTLQDVKSDNWLDKSNDAIFQFVEGRVEKFARLFASDKTTDTRSATTVSWSGEGVSRGAQHDSRGGCASRFHVCNQYWGLVGDGDGGMMAS